MNDRPSVFLSHSKIDKEFIEKIEHDLRKCRIAAWYDDWEIPPGKSLRKKVFEEGIQKCDAFFVYLTPNSIESEWVSKELDAAFIEQSKEKSTEILTFISNDDLIKSLPSDIASLKCPTINNENYEEGLRILITAIFEARISSILNERDLESENKILKLDKKIVDLQSQIFDSTNDKDSNLKSIEIALEGTIFRMNNNKKFTALMIFNSLWPHFAYGLEWGEKVHKILQLFKN